MQIYIEHQGQQTGPFTYEQIQAGLNSGLYQTTNLVWYQGAANWMPLHELLSKVTDPSYIPNAGPAQTSGFAIASLVCGVIGFACLFTSIPAIICGHVARKQIKGAPSRFNGDGIAIAGLITGYLSLAIMVISVGAAILMPFMMINKYKSDQTLATTSAKNIFLYLSAFQSEYGAYPNADTAKAVATDTGTPEITGNSANARFRQLFRADICDDESIFSLIKDGIGKPDGIITGDKALSSGECSFGYIDNTPASITAPRPLAMAPFKKGSNQFESTRFNNQAVILWTDGSVNTLPIDSFSGKAEINGQDLLDPTNPVWQGTPPNLVLPE